MTPLSTRLPARRSTTSRSRTSSGCRTIPSHPPFLFSLVKQHGEYVGPTGNSSASDAIALGSHVGTHIDALCHFSCGGRLYGGDDAAAVQSYAGGLERHPIDTIAPILRRGVLLDVAGRRTSAATITRSRRPTWPPPQRVEIRPGDVVLIRTGWARYFADPKKFISEVRGPGPAIEGARWLS